MSGGIILTNDEICRHSQPKAVYPRPSGGGILENLIGVEYRQYISELLQVYEEITKKTCMDMAQDFDITLSNLYQYRNGKGNPTAKTIDKIVDGVTERCPEALEKVEWKRTDGKDETDRSV